MEEINVQTVENEEVTVETTTPTYATDVSIRHDSLDGCNDSNQHEIAAITGLPKRIKELECARASFESSETGRADYYRWSSDTTVSENMIGYFVTRNSDGTIKIYSGENGEDVFGVTVEKAAFVGNQTEASVDDSGVNTAVDKDSNWALVATNGFVKVRCEGGIDVGENVSPDTTGMAIISAVNYGNKVVGISVDDDTGISYVTIYLGLSPKQASDIAGDVKILQDDMYGTIDNPTQSVKTRVATLETNVSNLQTNTNITDGKVDELETEITSIADRVAVLESPDTTESIGGWDIIENGLQVEKTFDKVYTACGKWNWLDVADYQYFDVDDNNHFVENNESYIDFGALPQELTQWEYNYLLAHATSDAENASVSELENVTNTTILNSSANDGITSKVFEVKNNDESQFYVRLDGSMYSSKIIGRLNNWEIYDKGLCAYYDNGIECRATINDTADPEAGCVIHIGKWDDENKKYDDTFYVRPNGYVGINYGHVGHWEVEEDGFVAYYDNYNFDRENSVKCRVYMSSRANGNSVFHAGEWDEENERYIDTFYVRPDGEVGINKGHVGHWNIDAEGLSSGDYYMKTTGNMKANNVECTTLSCTTLNGNGTGTQDNFSSNNTALVLANTARISTHSSAGKPSFALQYIDAGNGEIALVPGGVRDDDYPGGLQSVTNIGTSSRPISFIYTDQLWILDTGDNTLKRLELKNGEFSFVTSTQTVNARTN